MRCPNCDSENSDSAKFCKKCGTPLQKKAMNHENMIKSMSNESSGNNTTKYIIVALIVVAIVLAGAFVYLSGFGQNHTQDSQPQQVDNDQDVDEDDDSVQAQSSESSDSSPSTTSMSIDGGSFTTGGGLADKTYASIFVGSQHAGEKVKIKIKYSRDGSSLNKGNLVPKTVNSDGYIEVSSADAYKYFPDHAEIKLYDNSGNLLDTQSVDLSPEKGTQTF